MERTSRARSCPLIQSTVCHTSAVRGASEAHAHAHVSGVWCGLLRGGLDGGQHARLPVDSTHARGRLLVRARTCTRTSPSLALSLAPSPSPSLQRHSLLALSSPDPHPDQPRPSHWQRQRQRPGRCQHGVHLDAVRSARLDHRHLQTIPRARALRGAHVHMHMLMLMCTCNMHACMHAKHAHACVYVPLRAERTRTYTHAHHAHAHAHAHPRAHTHSPRTHASTCLLRCRRQAARCEGWT